MITPCIVSLAAAKTRCRRKRGRREGTKGLPSLTPGNWLRLLCVHPTTREPDCDYRTNQSEYSQYVLRGLLRGGGEDGFCRRWLTACCDLNSIAALFAPPPRSLGTMEQTSILSRPIVLTYDDEKERVEKERKSYLAGRAVGYVTDDTIRSLVCSSLQ